MKPLKLEMSQISLVSLLENHDETVFAEMKFKFPEKSLPLITVNSNTNCKYT